MLSGCFRHIACLMLENRLSLVAQSQTHIDLVISEALLHLIQQAAVCELTEGCEVVVGCWRHQFNLRKGKPWVKISILRLLAKNSCTHTHIRIRSVIFGTLHRQICVSDTCSTLLVPELKGPSRPLSWEGCLLRATPASLNIVHFSSRLSRLQMGRPKGFLEGRGWRESVTRLTQIQKEFSRWKYVQVFNRGVDIMWTAIIALLSTG